MSEDPRPTMRRPLVSLADFYAEDERRRSNGSDAFGFNWVDPDNTDPYRVCEVRWYEGTHEIAAVYTTYDPDRLAEALRHGDAPKEALLGLGIAAGPVLGPMAADARAAAILGRYLAERDRAATKVEVRIMGVLAHPLERYWVLRDAFFLETQKDGLATLQERIDACEQGDRHAVHDWSLWDLFIKPQPEQS